MTFADILTIWVPIILILISLSFAFGDWPGWRWVETLLVGGGMGQTFVLTWEQIVSSGIQPIQSGNYIIIPSFVFGLLLYMRLFPKYAWVARYGFLWIVSVGAGLALSSLWQGNIFVMVSRSISITGPTNYDTANNVLMFIIFITVLSYFIFTREQKGVFGTIAKTGRYFLMIALGVGFAVLISMYYNVALERVWWILQALGIIKV